MVNYSHKMSYQPNDAHMTDQWHRIYAYPKTKFISYYEWLFWVVEYITEYSVKFDRQLCWRLPNRGPPLVHVMAHRLLSTKQLLEPTMTYQVIPLEKLQPNVLTCKAFIWIFWFVDFLYLARIPIVVLIKTDHEAIHTNVAKCKMYNLNDNISRNLCHNWLVFVAKNILSRLPCSVIIERNVFCWYRCS